MRRGRWWLKHTSPGGKQKHSWTWSWCSATTCSRNTFRLNKGSLVQFCNVNSWQSLKYIYFLIYIDHFLASNELRNWPPILIKFLTISQSQKTPPKKQTTNKGKPSQQGNNCTIKVECKLCYVQTGIHGTEIILRSWHTPVEILLLSHPNFHLGKTDMYVIFFCIDKKRKQEGKAERNRCCPRDSGGIWLFWSWYQQLPPHGRNPVPIGLHGFPCSQDSNDGPHSSSSKRLNTNQNVSVDRIVKAQFSYQVKHFSSRKGVCNNWFWIC